MTEQEAINVFKGFKFTPREMKAVAMGIEALEKQIPFMPIKMENIYPDNQRKCKCGCFVSTVYKNRGGVTCVFEIAYKYCPNCGQKLEGFKE